MLKIPTRVRYSIRLMAHLADHGRSGKPVQLKHVAEGQSLSQRYLEQLVVPLKSAGLIKSVAGKRGGYYLAREARDISVGQVVEAAVGPLRVMDCLDPETACQFKEVCSARRMWGLVNARVMDVLFEYSVADLSELEMRALLGSEQDESEEQDPLRC